MNPAWRRVLFRPPSVEDLTRVLLAWRWLLGMSVLGMLAGAAYAWWWPAPVRARAEIVVDYNLEEALPRGTDRRLFYFLSRENKKLLSLAWSDDVLAAVAEVSGYSVDALRQAGILALYDERDGRWHFWATAPTASQARTWVATWARAFVDTARAKIMLAREVQQLERESRELAAALARATWQCEAADHAARALAHAQPARTPAEAWALWEALAWLDLSGTPLARTAVTDPAWLEAARTIAGQRGQACPDLLARLQAERAARLQQMETLLEQSGGVSPYTHIAPMQMDPANLPVEPARSQAQAMLAGALIGFGLAVMVGLVWPRGPEAT